jgi:CorA-like Mg2+ transporter protein
MGEQLTCLSHYCKLLEPQGFQVTSQNRTAMFELELDLLWKLWEGFEKRIQGELTDLSNQGQSLALQTLQHIEIQQEDHGKAILAFTTVTIVFLPLSFVTSLLGMKTADIRNQKTTQWLFWAIAVPLTIVVMVSAISIGYRSEQLRDALGRLFSKDATHTMLIMDETSDDQDGEERRIQSYKAQEHTKRRWMDRMTSRKRYSRGWV